MFNELDAFVEWSRLLLNEESRVSKELRKRMHDLFSFCSKISRTVSHIQQPDIMSKFRAFCSIPAIKTVFEDYKHIASENELIVKIAQSPAGVQELSGREEFRGMLFDLQPNFSFG
jgi:hypothetical protein